MKKIICFDMDGTIADLYGVSKWLEKLRAYDASPYREASPMWDMEILREVLEVLIHEGFEIRIISWLSKESNKQYDHDCREAKREWLKKYRFPADKIHLISYGRNKATCIKDFNKENGDFAILFDDNEEIRKKWKLGRTYDPTKGDLLDTLYDIALDFDDFDCDE